MWKKISEFLSENFQFLVVKFSIYLHRRVFVMQSSMNMTGTLLCISCMAFCDKLPNQTKTIIALL